MQSVLMYIVFFVYRWRGTRSRRVAEGEDAALEKKINHHRLPTLQVLEDCVRVRHAGR